MAKSKPIEKQPYEAFPITGNFTAVMDETETIDLSSSAILVFDKDGLEDASMVDDSTLNIDGHKFFGRIQGGDPAKSPYKVSFRITTSTGNRWEIDALLEVENK